MRVSYWRHCEVDFKVFLGYNTPYRIWMPAPFCGLCWNCSKETRCVFLALRLPTCCQSDVFKAQTLSGHSLPTPKTSLALRIKSQVFAESLLGAPFVLVTSSPAPLCLRHLGLPQFCKHTSSFLPQGLWTCCSRCQEHSVQAGSSFLRFQLRCQPLEEPSQHPK